MKFTSGSSSISTFLTLLIASISVAVVNGQATTMADELGNIILATIVTDVDGDPSETLLVSTLTPVDEITATSPSTRTTAATTTATTTATTATDPDTNVGAPAVVGAPVSRCTDATCVPPPTVYTQNGVVMTWTATTPTTPIPTWTSSGNVQPASAYITTISTAKGLGAGSLSWGRNPFRFEQGDWTVMASVAVVGGLVGAVAVL
ncbi:uncharacterized protein JCM6883_001429 [Sporobolomyces salmoneus]|uniref:uncharacterized protein n=1 Tax=Sporobolomyces salmoneus TaxID=183962 RepID=UPI003178D04B